jgi:hypothetical protein
MSAGSMEDLTPTEVAQPAILAHTAAVLSILETELGFLRHIRTENSTPPVPVLGHSLGEFAALASLGVFSLLEAISLVVRIFPALVIVAIFFSDGDLLTFDVIFVLIGFGVLKPRYGE